MFQSSSYIQAMNPDQGATNPDQDATNPDQGATNPDQGAMNPDRDADPVLTPFTKLSEAAQTELLENCQKQLAELELLQDIVSLETETLPEAVTRLIFTESELSMFLNSAPKLSSKHPEVLLEAGKEKMLKQCSELEAVLSWNKVKREKFLETCQWEQKELERKREVYTAAVARTEQIRMEKLSGSPQQRMQNLKDKIYKLKEYQEKLLERMMSVLKEHFPSPEDEQDLLPIETILERLMNKALQTPHDPYVTIDESFWPAYIETLLRYGIALRHPEDNFKIRLEFF